MEIFQKLAGYTLGGADQVRRAMSKKKADKLAKERKAFVYGDESRGINGCVKNGIKAEAAEELFEQMTDFARYAFNASHATAYAFNSYVTAYLKFYYPAEFLSSAMNFAENDKIPGLIAEAKTFGIKVFQPDINRSTGRFSVVGKDILYGLNMIKNVGSAATPVVDEREKNGPYRSVADLFLRVGLEKSAMEALSKTGAFDRLCPNRFAVKEAGEMYREKMKTITGLSKKVDGLKALMPFAEELDTEVKMDAKQKELGFRVGKKPMTTPEYQAKIAEAEEQKAALINEVASMPLPEVENDCIRALNEEYELLGTYVSAHPMDVVRVPNGFAQIANVRIGNCRIAGVVRQMRTIETKKSTKDKKVKMSFFKLEDKTGSIECILFPNAYEVCRTTGQLARIKDGQVFFLNGRVEKDDRSKQGGTLKFIVTNLQ